MIFAFFFYPSLESNNNSKTGNTSSNKYHIEEYEQRFLNSLKQLNAPEWLVKQPTKRNETTDPAMLLPPVCAQTKPRYERLRQKSRNTNYTNTTHGYSRSLSSPRNPIVTPNSTHLSNNEDDLIKNGSSHSLLLTGSSKHVNYAHLARSRHYASMRSDGTGMKRSLSSFTPATSHITNANSVCSSSSSINQSCGGTGAGVGGFSSILLASKSNTSLNSNRDATWYKPKQLQLPMSVEKCADTATNSNTVLTTTTTTFESTLIETVTRTISSSDGVISGGSHFFFLMKIILFCGCIQNLK